MVLGYALSVMVRIADLVVPPGSGDGEGVYAMGIVQLWPGAIELNWQPVLKPERLKFSSAKEKSFEFVPVIFIPETCRVLVPIFVTTTSRIRLRVLIDWFE